jgi:3-phenylpropionate/cinnamic acid dioxygenase small subunit
MSMLRLNTKVFVAALVAILAGFQPLAAADAAAGAGPKLSAEDYIEIQQLYANYAHALDKGEGERFAATFVEDGEFTGGRGSGRGTEVRTPTKGKEGLQKMGSRSGTRHFTANLVITQTPQGAKGSCYLLLFNVRNVPATITETAIYDDTLVKTLQGWKFKKRIVWRDDDDITPFKPKPLPAAPEKN